MPKLRTRRNGSPGSPKTAEVDVARSVRRELANVSADQPLPTTREFGSRFGVAAATVFRVLQKMAGEGEIWQHPTSGRYYPTAARALLDRPEPMACLIRRLELASEQYRELLEGVSLGCGALRRTMLLWHDELLVNHPEPHHPPVFAPVPQQCAILEDFLGRHGKNAGSFLFDQLWSDEALSVYARRLTPGVVLYRSCSLPYLSNVRADFRSGAFKALTHLLARGFEQIIPIEPFSGDPAVAEFHSALEKVAEETGCRDRVGAMASASTNDERTRLIERLRELPCRTALVCPEDNVTLFLSTAAREAGLCPGRIGLLSVMGTDFATKAGISCLRYDFRAMGRLAVDAVVDTRPVHHVLEPQLVVGTTT
jgi:DNA-binding transcriptional regulator YhcF (GntR family)